MKIREMKYQEIEFCCELVLSNWGMAAAERCHWQALEMFKGGPYAPTFYVADAGITSRVPVGFAAFQPTMRMPGEFDFIWIAIKPSHQSLKIGKTLTEYRLAEVRKRDGTSVSLVTQKPRYFNRNFGFRVIEDYSDGWVLMIKHLGPTTMGQ